MKTNGPAGSSPGATTPLDLPGLTGVLDGVATGIGQQVADYCGSTGVPGYLVGVYHDGRQSIVAHGTANTVPAAVRPDGPPGDLQRYEGRYRSNQLRVDVRAVDGELEETMTYEPLDDAQARIFSGFAGGPVAAPPRRFAPVGADLFAPAGMPLDAFRGYSRQLLVSYHELDDGALYRCAGGRMTRREQRG